MKEKIKAYLRKQAGLGDVLQGIPQDINTMNAYSKCRQIRSK